MEYKNFSKLNVEMLKIEGKIDAFNNSMKELSVVTKNLSDALDNKFIFIDDPEGFVGYRFIKNVNDESIDNSFGLRKDISITCDPKYNVYIYNFTFVWNKQIMKWHQKVSDEFVDNFENKEEILSYSVISKFAKEIETLTGIKASFIYRFVLNLNKNNISYKGYYSNSYDNISYKTKSLPGVTEMVNCPCNRTICNFKEKSIWSIIQHLNDDVGWSREKIADWLDELHDTGQVNIEFESWNQEQKQKPEIKGPILTASYTDEVIVWKNLGYIKEIDWNYYGED